MTALLIPGSAADRSPAAARPASLPLAGVPGDRRDPDCPPSDDWMRSAACVGRTDLFFPPYAERPQARVRREREAKALCDACTVRTSCRAWGRTNHEYGIWGGENEEERVLAGYSLIAPIGTRTIKRVRAAMAMPLAELDEPSAADLAHLEDEALAG
jgi:WhiB family redox-sensing transcriptional regulator